MSSAPDRLTDLFRYTRWADEKIIATLTEMNAPEQDDLADAMQLLSHQLRAQEAWLARVSGTDAPPFWETDDLETCRERSAACTEKWGNVLAAEDDLNRKVSYRNSSGTAFETPLDVIAHHVVNHATHHRAQVVREIRRAGGTPPATDYIFYDRDRSRQN